MWPWTQKNSVAPVAEPEQHAEPAISHAIGATLRRIQLCRLRKLDRVIARIRIQDERCRLSLEMSARQEFRPEVDRTESLRLRRLVDEYIRLTDRARDDVALDVCNHLAPEDQRFIQRVLEDHRRPVTEDPLPLGLEIFLADGVNIAVKPPAKKRTTYGDGLDALLQ